MTEPKITTPEKLQDYLHHAMQLEHATIPPYLLALYSIHPGTNPDATQVLRVVVVEEMLHLTLAANILNAVGGTPDLTVNGFVPLYPAYLPDGEQDFTVDLQPFSKDAINTFLKIERPGKAPTEARRLVPRARKGLSDLGNSPSEENMHFYSIGEFYEEITRGLKYLHEKMGAALFPPERQSLQLTSEYYYSGGASLFPVTNLRSALDAINVIIEQGEGFDSGVYSDAGELAHDFRFEQLMLGRYYMRGDEPGKPTGPALTVDWEAAYPFKKNARVSDYTASPELYTAAVSFNEAYAEFLTLVTQAYNGKPNLLLEAVPKMFKLRNKITQLIHNPLPGTASVNAAPTFEINNAPAEVQA